MTVKTNVDFGDLLQIHPSNANGDWIRPESCFFFFFFCAGIWLVSVLLLRAGCCLIGKSRGALPRLFDNALS